MYMPGTDKKAATPNGSEEKEVIKNDAESVTAALKQAEQDIKKDPDLGQKPDSAADLDEGELARFEGD